MNCLHCGKKVFIPIKKITVEYVDNGILVVHKGKDDFCDDCFYEMVATSFRPSHLKLLDDESEF